MMEKVTNLFSMLMKVWRTGMKKEIVLAEVKTNGLKMVGVKKVEAGLSVPEEIQPESVEQLESAEQPECSELSGVSDLPLSKPDGKKNGSTCLTEQVNDFLRTQYDFRYNLLTEETEFRPLDDAGKAIGFFQPVSKRDLNTFCMEAHAKGISCWDKDVSRYIYSTRIAEYHPFRLYMDELPVWDGIDRVTSLALRVSDLPLWVRGFHTWLLGVAAQWSGKTGIHANSVAPILVSSEQGRLKSTFCKSLMPAALQHYYMDNLKLTSEGKAERLMSEMGLINLDEFDKYAAGKMPLLKNLMQMSSLHICKAYQKNYRDLPRVASFIGTSNRYDLLNDPTGSRCYLCVEVIKPIDCEGIEHAQLFAQLKAELEQGIPYWFSKEQERELQRHNVSFYHACPAEDVFNCCFRVALPEEECLHLSAAEIYQELKKMNSAALRGFNPNQFAQVLTKMGVGRKHTEYGNVYSVIRR